MFKQYLIQSLGALYENKIIIFDLDRIEDRYSYCAILEELGFEIINFQSATHLRSIYNNDSNLDRNIAIVVESDYYVPFDILKSFYCVEISWDRLFPNISRDTIVNNKTLDLDLLYNAYYGQYEDLTIYEDAKTYIVHKVYGKENVQYYLQQIIDELSKLIQGDMVNYSTWLSVAAKKGKAEYLAAQSGLSTDFTFLDEGFSKFTVNEYKYLSSVSKKDSPIIVSRVMDYIAKSNEKIALIVMDGMSVFDFNILASEFSGIDYQEDYIYAMIPTTTSISRQSLLAGKFPVELKRPFDLSREEGEFYAKAKSLGYLENQILYSRGFTPNIGPNVKYLSVIINDIDNLVHGQTQGRIGMYYDINVLAKSCKLQNLIKKLFSEGFNIYLTSDHGNTLCTGLGVVRGIGVEVETKSKRMLILKDFAQNDNLINSFNLIEYPGYFLNKQYKYYICRTGTSFDVKDSIVMTHGGISIDEVVIPFIKIKAVQNG